MDAFTLQWLERAQYDLETAHSLLNSRRFLYVAFMCQQAIEKTLKAYQTANGKTPLFVHNLPRLAETASLLEELEEEQKQLLADLNPYYIKARYGEYKDSLSKVCNEDQAKIFLQKTEAFIQWLKQKMK